MKGVVSIMLVLLLAGCSETVSPPAQKAQRARITPQTTLNMAQLCKDQAAIRYNTQTQLVDVNHFEQFQASYELSGRTGKNERFICSFDPDGQFMHLSMRAESTPPGVNFVRFPETTPFRTVYLAASGYTDSFL